MDVLNTQRSQKWDILKFLLIFLVVLGHFAEYYTSGNEHIRSLIFYIYIFHMPVFIFVSGLFAKKNIENKRYDKFTGYILIYILLKIFFHFVKIWVGRAPQFNLFVEGGVPWFMLALFFFNLITIAVNKLPKAAVFAVSIILACAAGFFPFIRDFLAVSRVIVFYPFFYLGYCSDRQKTEKFCNGKVQKWVAVAVLIIAAIFVFVQGDEIYTLRNVLTGRNPYNTLGEFESTGCLLRLAHYAVAALVGGSVIILVPNKTPFGICGRLGQRTLAVYGLHYGAIYVIYELLNLKSVFADVIGRYDEWVIIPLSVLVTLFFSLSFFNKALIYIMNLPCVLSAKVRKKQADAS